MTLDWTRLGPHRFHAKAGRGLLVLVKMAGDCNWRLHRCGPPLAGYPAARIDGGLDADAARGKAEAEAAERWPDLFTVTEGT